MIMELYEFIFRRGLLVHEMYHGLFALPFAIFLYRKSRSVNHVLILFTVAYLLDLDHLVDYFIYYGNNFDIRLFWQNDYFEFTPYRFVILHGWEWLMIVGYLAYRKGKKVWNSFYTPIAFALFTHLLLDSINVGSFLFYFFFYRALNGFIV